MAAHHRKKPGQKSREEGSAYAKAMSVVSSFWAWSGEYVVWIMPGAAARDNVALWRMVAEELAKWDKELSSYLYTAGYPHSLVETYKLLVQIDLATRRAGKIIIVCDKFELIDQRYVEIIENIIRACSGTITFIMKSNQDIAVGERALLKLHNPDPLNLQLSKEETRLYYTSMGIVIDDPVLNEVMQITQGWASAVYLLGECLVRWEQLTKAGLDSAVANLFTIFFQETYQPFSQEVRQAQILLSFLEGFPLELARDLTSLGADALQELTVKNQFILYNREMGTCYFQSLFHDFLKTQQLDISTKMKLGFLRKAAQWYEKKQLYLQAIDCYVQCGDFGKVLAPLKNIPPLDTDWEVSNKLLESLRQIPPAYMEQNAPVGIRYYLTMLNIGQVSEAYSALEKLRSQLEKKNRTPEETGVLSDIHLIFSFSAWNNGSIEYLRHMILADQYQQGPSALFSGIGDLFIGGGVLRFKDMQPGDLDMMRDAALQAVPYMRTTLPEKAGGNYLAAAECHMHRMEFQEAVYYAGKAISEANGYRQWNTMCECYYLLQRVSMVTGGLDAAIYYMDNAVSCLEHSKHSGPHSIDQVCLRYFYQYVGLYDKIKPWSQLKLPMDILYLQGMKISRELFIQAHYMVQVQKQYYPAISHIDQSLPICYDAGMWFYWLKLIVLKAVIYCFLGKWDIAVRYFTEAYKMSEANRVMLPFVELGEYTTTLIEDIRDRCREVSPTWIKEIYSRAVQYCDAQKRVRAEFLRRNPSYGQNILDTLAEREYLVLRHLCNGLSTEETAKEMNIQASSVYRYLSMAYKKIGAKDRNDAVRIATIEGMLGEPRN